MSRNNKMEDVSHFVDFARKFKAMELMKKVKPEAVKDFYGLQGFDDGGRHFYANINDSILRARIFNINDSKKKLLTLTDTPAKNDEIHYPFEVVFLNVEFTKEELAYLGVEIDCERIIGIMAREGKLIHEGKEVGKDLNMTMLSKQGNDYWFDTFNKNPNLDEDFQKKYEGVNTNVMENPTTDKKARDFVHKFFLNFINFLNNPEIEYTEHKRSEGNIRRKLKQGKVIIPATCSIKVSGKLKVYLDEIEHGNCFQYSHRFWVRGHFRDLVADRYIHKKRIWIFPFIKGHEDKPLIEKVYNVEFENGN